MKECSVDYHKERDYDEKTDIETACYVLNCEPKSLKTVSTIRPINNKYYKFIILDENNSICIQYEKISRTYRDNYKLFHNVIHRRDATHTIPADFTATETDFIEQHTDSISQLNRQLN